MASQRAPAGSSGLLPPISLLCSLALGCTGGGLPEGFGAPVPGAGPIVRWDVNAEDLPEIPLPNDFATWADPTSPTGRRLNASLVAPTSLDQLIRQQFDTLDGWTTSGTLSVSFDAPLDTDEILARQGRGRFSEADFQGHAIYLIDLETGEPVPLDINSGMGAYTLTTRASYADGDPREGESNLLFETVSEDLDGDGLLDPGEDTDFDGVLDVANTLDGMRTADPFEDVDRMLWFYERETNTLLLRPLVPLREAHEYAVVLTDRLVGLDGSPVRSPFDHAHHISQRASLAGLADIFAERRHLYGDSLADEGWAHVPFAWTFTTQSIHGDVQAIREGLYGRGPLARLAEDYPPVLRPMPLRGGSRPGACEFDPSLKYVITADDLRTLFDTLGVEGLGEVGPSSTSQVEAVLQTLENVSHMVLAFYESPYLLGDPEDDRPDEMWRIDSQTGEARLDRALVPILITVPKETAAHQQPFRVALYAHGYGSHFLESILLGGTVAAHGIATAAIAAQGHGLPLDPGLARLLSTVLGSSCLAPLGSALTVDRAIDLNGDEVADNAGLFYSAYGFHSRDALRQTLVDWLQATRILRSFEGDPRFPEGRAWIPGQIQPPGRSVPALVFDGDMDADGTIDRMGDFDGDGTIDLGGWDRPIFAWGSSLGGVISMLVAGAEPSVHAAAPISGGARLGEIGARTDYGPVQASIWMRVMGPILASAPSPGPEAGSGCAADDHVLYFHLPDLIARTRVDIRCIPAGGIAPGDAIVAQNLANGERRCALAGPSGRFSVPIPSSAGDPLRLEVHAGVGDALDASSCTWTSPSEPPLVLDTWGLESGSARLGRCPRCATYQGVQWQPGDPLVSPMEGLGRSRQSPSLRRIALLSQTAYDPADPFNYARRIFLEPRWPEDSSPHDRSILVLASAGDETVPTANAYAYARAAGILPFLPPDAPDELAEYRAPPGFLASHGAPTPTDTLIDTHAMEGMSRFDRHPVAGSSRGFLFDVDDIAEGRQLFDPSGSAQVPAGEPGLQPGRPALPLRWARSSRPMSSPSDAVFDFDPRAGAPTSGLLTAYVLPRGHHVIAPTDPSKSFDDGEYYINLVGWYYGSLGTDLRYLSDPVGHHCLAESSCLWGG
ncbi:MAG: hypothetical protein OEY14_07375 [Myxococcales bacterium]|nr:hypothetical protein [Myxococcales bacterium]